MTAPADTSVPVHPTAPADLSPHPTVPGYQLLGPLGQGGMGVVYRAVQTDLGREVAVKMLTAGGLTADDERRFDAEARAAAAVRHPHVVEVFHTGRAGGRPFLAMELLPGGSLADALRDGPLPPAEAARLAAGVARGVAALHAAGVLHRDLKPGNVLLTADRVPKVTDFGLARLDGAAGVDAATARVGTPSCMAPEQVRGGAVDGRADVYGLGAVLYALLVGRPPFAAPSAEEAIRRVLADDPVPPRAVQPGVPRDLETVALKCLDKDPARRYGTAAEVADDLDRWRAGRPILARPAGRLERAGKWVRRNRAAAAALAALAVGFGAATAGAVVAVLRTIEATEARGQADLAKGEADQRAAEASENAEFMTDVVSQGDPTVQAEGGREIDPRLPVKIALDRAVRQLDIRFAGQPLVEARVRSRVGTVYYQYKDYPQALVQLQRAIRLREPLLPADAPEQLSARVSVGELLRLNDRPDEAAAVLAAAYADCRRSLGDHPDTFKCANNLGLLHLRAGVRLRDRDGQPAAAEAALARAAEYHADAHDGRRRLFPADHPDVLRSLHNRGLVAYQRSRYDEAEGLYRQALDGRRRRLGPAHPETISTVGNLAEVYNWRQRPGDADAARLLFREALALAEQTEPAAWTTGKRRADLGEFLYWQKEYAEAVALLTNGFDELTAAADAIPAESRSLLPTTAGRIAEVWGLLGRQDLAARWKETERGLRPVTPAGR